MAYGCTSRNTAFARCRLPQVWDEKNRKEQDYVASYIRRQLLSLDIHSTENGPYPAYAGALSHLKTDFRFSLKDNKGLGDLLKVLHPTPAVCGLPKEEAYQLFCRMKVTTAAITPALSDGSIRKDEQTSM